VTRTPHRALRRVPAAALLLALAVLPGPARAATQVGFKGPSYAGFGAESTGGAITGEKPESKLWYHAGSWWAVMLSASSSGAKTIWRLGGTAWIDTHVVVDARPWTKEDVLADGNTLYIASRGGAEATGNQLRRFTYANGTYALNAGFPKSIPGSNQETLTLAKDSTKTLWITYEKNGAIYVSHSLGTDTSWTPEFVLPVSQASSVGDDDISSVIAFADNAGPAVGVMFSDQTSGTDYFVVHRDGSTDSQWTVETALSGGGPADDHLNLKTVEGRVYASVKIEDPSGSETQIWLLVRSKSGAWQKHSVAPAAEGNTRPVTVLHLDPAARRIHVFMSVGEGTAAHGIVSKSSDMDSVDFPSEASFVLRGPNNEMINNVTSTKQATSAATGIVVLASDGANYWWNKLPGVHVSPVGVVRGNTWFLSDENLVVTKVFKFGSETDTPIAGDWDDDGDDEPGVRRGNVWYLADDAPPTSVTTFTFASANDTPTAGDWDDDGDEEPGVRRGNVWYLADVAPPTSVTTFTFASAKDTPIAGDWDGDGDGDEEPGVRRGNVWYLADVAPPTSVTTFTFASAKDNPIAGDWDGDGDGDEEPGVRRGNVWYVADGTPPGGVIAFAFGLATDAPIAGDWDGS
jgi:hypothetical protein